MLALYPASFDPVTNGHIDVALRAAKLFDELVIAPFDSPSKNILFPTSERIEMIKEAMASVPNVRVESYTGLTVHYADMIGAKVIVRGLRSVSDFEWELQLAQNYRTLNPNIEICCLLTSQTHSFIASSMVKEIARLGGDVNSLVPAHVASKLYKAYGVTPRISNHNSSINNGVSSK